MTTIAKNVGAELRRQRKRRGLTLKGLATLVGVTYQQVQKYETGKNSINMCMLVQMERSAGLSSLKLLNAARRA